MNRILTALASMLLGTSMSFAVQLHEGVLNEAPYKVAVPADGPQGKVFFHVHGWRPDEAPHEADLNLEYPLYESLLESGWIIARTAFLKNGVDHDAHTEDLRALSEWIDENFGPIETIIMEGESTAGTLVLRISEQDPELVDGVIALGPYIDLEDPSKSDYLTASPQKPAIMMSNMSEVLDPVAYAAHSEGSVAVAQLRPLLRPGHVNVNWTERLAALEDLMLAIETDQPLPALANGTRKVPARDTGTVKNEATLKNRVITVNPFYGNAELGFHPEELEKAGLDQGDTLVLEAASGSWEVFYGSSYGDVPLGEWVIFPTANDTLLLVRNHQSAIETADLSIDDAIKIHLQ